MAEQPQPRDPRSLSTQFRDTLEDLTHEWGFVVVRTAYAAVNDEAQWAAALKKLQAYATPDSGNTLLNHNTFVLPVIGDSTILNGADYPSVRKAFNGWVEDFIHRERKPSDDDDEWPSHVRRDVFIVIDELALNSLFKAPDFVPGKISNLNLDLEPWIVVVDTEDPTSMGYSGGGPYMGFTRAHARALSELFNDLSSRSLEFWTPVREYDGQIPLYDYYTHEKLIDPPGGVAGRYKFPRGTPRGRDMARAWMEEIERAVGKVDGSSNDYTY